MKTSIEKSHSVYSNFKLTLLSILTIIFVSIFVFIIIIYKHLSKTYFIALLGTSGILSLVMLTLFSKFTRWKNPIKWSYVHSFTL